MSRNSTGADPSALDQLPLFRDNMESGAEEDYDLAAFVDAVDEEDDDAVSRTPVTYEVEPGLTSARASRRITRARALRASTGSVGILAGAFLALLGALWGLLVLAGVGGVLKLSAAMAPTGLQPPLLVVGGLALLAIGVVQSRTSRVLAAMQELHGDLDDVLGHVELIRVSTSFTHEQELARHERSELAGEDLGAVLMALQRYDEKLNNLTKATKMYGKPLVDISNQMSEATHQLGQNNELLESLQRSTDLKIESLRESTGHQLESLSESTGHQLESLLESTGRQLASLQQGTDQQIERLEAAIQRELEKLSACDSGQDELIRRRMDEMETQLEQCLAGHGRQVRENVERLTDELQARVHELLRTLQQSSKSTEGGVGQIATDLRELRQGLTELKSSVSSGLRDLASRPVARAAAASAPANDGGSGGGGGGGDGELAQQIAGSRKAPASNVMGAIAKLKKMRG